MLYTIELFKYFNATLLLNRFVSSSTCTHVVVCFNRFTAGCSCPRWAIFPRLAGLSAFHVYLYSSMLYTIESLSNTLNEILPNRKLHVYVAIDGLRLALTEETKAWKICYGNLCNATYRVRMNDLFEFIGDVTVRLNRSISDLDDVRSMMATLKELRDKEISIDMAIGPIEVGTTVVDGTNDVFRVA